MIDLDDVVEHLSRRLAGGVSRRSVLRSLGGLLVGAASLPLLPVARGASAAAGKTQEKGLAARMEEFAERACACADATCANKVNEEFVSWAADRTDARAGDDERSRVQAAQTRLGECLARHEAELIQALDVPGPSLVEVPIDYAENLRLTEHLGALAGS